MKMRDKKVRKVKAGPNPTKQDPTRTATLRAKFVAEINRRFSQLARDVIRLVDQEDSLGLKETSHDPFTANEDRDNCGTGAGGFQRGNDCARRVDRVSETASKIPVTQDQILRDGKWEEGKWGKYGSDDVYAFRTTSGRRYVVTLGNGSIGRELWFKDDLGSTSVTDGGHAFEVFSRVSAAVVALIKARKIESVTFTAKEPSRRKLYDRLVKVVSSAIPEYAVFQSTGGRTRRYVLALRDQIPKLRQKTTTKYNRPTEMVVNHVDSSWFYTKGWTFVANEDENCGTGSGGFQRGNTCAAGSRVDKVIQAASRIPVTSERVMTGYGSSKWIRGKWGIGYEGEYVYVFDTSSGRTFSVGLSDVLGFESGPLKKAKDISFMDDRDRTKITDGGEAFEVFAKVSAASVAVIKGKDLDVVTFTAEEPSRRKLYDKLVSTVVAALPGYAALEVDGRHVRRYVVAKKSMIREAMEELGKDYAHTPKMLVNQVNPSWFSSEFWITNVFCPTGRGGGVDPTCSPHYKDESGWGGSDGKKVRLQYYPETEAKVKDLFKGRMTVDDVARVAGAWPGCTVELSSDARPFVKVVIHHPAYPWPSVRTVLRDRIVNEEFYLSREYAGQGLGTTIFHHQVQNAVKHGFSSIETTAARNDDPDPKNRMNGYYTWPRLGYDGDLPKHVQRETGLTRVSDLMATPEGRAWWEEHGDTIHLSFDLSEGSLSRRVLDAYIKERATRKRKPTTNLGRGGRDNLGLHLGQDWQGTWNYVQATRNANPKGCNQYTGPNCDGDSGVADRPARRINRPDWRDPNSFTPSREQVEQFNEGVWDAAKKIAKRTGASISHAEHALAEWAKHEIALQVMRLPTPIQTALTATYFLTRMGTKAAFATWTASQAFAERVAREQGLTDEEAATLRSVLATRDIVALKPVQVGIVSSGYGEYAAPLSMIPPATAEYLLRSTIKNPMAVARAAGKLVKGAIKKLMPEGKPKNRYTPQVTEITRNTNPYHDELGRFSSTTVKVGGTTFIKPPRSIRAGDKVVMVDLSRFDSAWKKDQGFHVGDEGVGGIGSRYERFGEWMQKGLPVEMPEVALYHGEPRFTNGRHRTAWFRDQGFTHIPMAVHKGDAREMQRLYGAPTTNSSQEQDFQLLADSLKSHGYDDWYQALLAVAMDELGVEEGVELADELWKAQPTSPVVNSNPNHDELGRFASSGWSGNDIPSHDSWRELEPEDGYIYHATNLENAHDIKDSHLVGHRPWHGTDQREWPDGSTAKRTYFTNKPSTAWQFAPEHGKPVLLRMKKSNQVKREDTGDLYTEGIKIRPTALEVYTTEGWKPLKSPTTNAEEKPNCGTGAGGFQPGNSCATGKTGGESTSERSDSEHENSVHHLGVKSLAQSLKEDWRYHGKVNVYDQEGRVFEVGGRKWREAGNCVLSDGTVTIHSRSVGSEIGDVRRICAHEMMHGIFERVWRRSEEERRKAGEEKADTRSGRKLRMDDGLYPQFAEEFPTFARLQPFFYGMLSGGPRRLREDDGITPYSKAYWADQEERKVSTHLAVHETLAEIAALHESTGVIHGSKTYRQLYKLVREEYRVLEGHQRTRRMKVPNMTVNSETHVMYVDAHFVPTTPNDAVYISIWKDGRHTWARREDIPQEVRNANWRFQPNPEKVRQFQEWLRNRIDQTLRSQGDRQLWEQYAQEGFRKGQARAYDDYMRRDRDRARSREDFSFYQGGRDQFLRSSFHNPVAVETVQLLAGRSFDELKNVTTDMSNRMSRVLTDGLVQGQSPIDIAKKLVDEVNLSKVRAELVARTEIVRAHSEGQLNALEAMGADEVGIMVEWSVSGVGKTKKGYPSPCPKCAALKGIVLKVSEAHGLIPRHPRCMCAFVPAPTVMGKQPGQKTTKAQIEAAISKSRSEDEDWGSDLGISKDRGPTTNRIARYLVNSERENCGTGAGGFKEGNTCAVSGKALDLTYKDRIIQVYEAPNRKQLENLFDLRNKIQYLKGMVFQGSVYVWDGGESVTHGQVARLMKGDVPEPEWNDRFAVNSPVNYEYVNGEVLKSRGTPEVNFYDNRNPNPKIAKWAESLDLTANEGKPNCGTGAGGFKSGNTCAAGKEKFVGQIVSKREHVRAGEIEHEVADGIGARVVSLEDGVYTPRDATYRGHQLEIKSLLKGSKQAISVHPDALYRKVMFMRDNPTARGYHTIVVDDRNEYEGGAHSENYSGHRLYYKRGSGRYSLTSMHRVRSMAELRRLILMDDADLPDKAYGTLPSSRTEIETLREKAERAHESRLAKDRARKQRLREERMAANRFCPTGKGGGIDPTCTKDESGWGGGSNKSYIKSGDYFDVLYHGGKNKIKEVDPDMLQSRDSGYYGQGFYLADSPTAAKMYGRRISKFKISPEAKVLISALWAKDASQDLVNAIKGYYEDVIIPKARARGKEDLAREELEHVLKSPISWKEAVVSYANHHNFDIVKHSSGEIVVRNPKVLISNSQDDNGKPPSQ